MFSIERISVYLQNVFSVSFSKYILLKDALYRLARFVNPLRHCALIQLQNCIKFRVTISIILLWMYDLLEVTKL